MNATDPSHADLGDDLAANRGHHGDRHGRGVIAAIRHVLSAHSHDPAAAIDSATAHREGMRALAIGLGGLGVTAVLQVVVVTLSGSVALLADTVHNFSDALTALPLGFAFWLGRRSPDRRYTYGYGRAEDLAGIFVVAVIALSAGVAAWQAVLRLIDPQAVDRPGLVAVAGVIGFVGNELVARYRIRVGRRTGSVALVTDGRHARTDGLTSLAVVAAALGTMAGWGLADPIVGLAISAAIVNVLRQAARDIARRLMDRVDPELVDRLEHQLARVTGVQTVDRVRVRWIGHELEADAEVALDPTLDLAAAHDVLEDARHRLLHRVPRLGDVLLHANPAGHRDAHDRTRHHNRAGLDVAPTSRVMATGGRSTWTVPMRRASLLGGTRRGARGQLTTRATIRSAAWGRIAWRRLGWFWWWVVRSARWWPAG